MGIAQLLSYDLSQKIIRSQDLLKLVTLHQLFLTVNRAYSKNSSLGNYFEKRLVEFITKNTL